MFDLKSFIVTNIVNGVKNGTFTKEYGNIMAVNYMVKNVITQDDVEKVSTQIQAWEAEKEAVFIPVEPSEEIPVEDLMEEGILADGESVDEKYDSDLSEEPAESPMEENAEEAPAEE